MEQLSVWVVKMGDTGWDWPPEMKRRRHYNNVRESYDKGKITGIYESESEAYDSLPHPERLTSLGEMKGGEVYEYNDVAMWVFIKEHPVWKKKSDVDEVSEEACEPRPPVSREELEELYRRIADLERRTLKIPDGTPPPVVNPFPYGPWGPPTPPITIPPWVPEHPYPGPYYVGDPPYTHPGYYVGDFPPFGNVWCTYE